VSAVPVSEDAVLATALVSRSPSDPPSLEQVWVPWPVGDQVLVDVEAVGGCHADRAVHAGSFPVALPMVLGHEGTGVVRAVGPLVRGLDIGDRVVLSYAFCDRCPSCRSGEPTQCSTYIDQNFPSGKSTTYLGPRGRVNAGFFGQSSFSTVALAAERNAVPVSTDLPPTLLAPLGCGVQTGVGAVLDVAALKPTDSLLIIGLGTVGFSALYAAFSVGCRTVFAADVAESRLAEAEAAGVLATVDASLSDWPRSVRRVLGSGVDVVVECSGAPASLAAAMRAVRPGGTVVVAGAPPFGTRHALDVADLVNRSVTLRGTAEGGGRARERIPALVHMIETGALPLDQLVDVRTFDELPRWCSGETNGDGLAVKAVFVPD
jgi:aryl-alcohol dehydrogenase